MTMVRLRRFSIRDAVRAAGQLAVVLPVCLAGASLLRAEPLAHFRHAGVMPPGAIGTLRLGQGGPLSGYIQPVEMRGPEGSRIALAEGGDFGPGVEGRLLAGMRIADVYRLKVTQIPRQAGLEVYPTIEVIDRMYPPVGHKWRFPIPVQLTLRDLELALGGKLVTRVIYVEDPRRALPHAEDPKMQNWYEVAPGEDPLIAADQLGRPVAILRLGARIPSASGPSPQFLFGSPAWFHPPEVVEAAPVEPGATPPPPIEITTP